jgi:hypothetical protein
VGLFARMCDSLGYQSVAPLGLSESGGCRFSQGLRPGLLTTVPSGLLVSGPVVLEAFSLNTYTGWFRFSVPIAG